MSRVRICLPVFTLICLSTIAVAEERTVVKEVVVDAPRAEVWKAWTTPEGITTFFGNAANIELRHRGPYEILFNLDEPEGERGADGCEVLSWLDEEMLCFTWNAPMKFADVRMQRSFVVVQFSDAEDGRTAVKLTHGGFGEGEQWDEVYDYFNTAWGYVTENLVKRFDGTEVRPGTALTPQPYRHFTYFLRPADESFLTRTEFSAHEQEKLGGHVEHPRNLAATGKIVCAGPCFDPTMYPDSADTMIPLQIPSVGIVIFKAHSLEEAKAIMEADPAVAAGIFKAQVNEMNLAFMRP